MKRKILFTILTVVMMVLLGLSFSACTDENVPVESIVVTKLPKLEYYRGDKFEIGSAEITVFYENGKTKVVPLNLNMISEYDADYIGEQILTIKYEDNTAYIKVKVAETPIYNVSVVEGNYKKEYVQDQILDLNNLKLRVVYSNGYSEVIDVTSSMVSGFESVTIGEKQLVISYKGKSTTLSVNVVKKSIRNVSLEAPAKVSYVVGDTVDFTGGKLFIAYNNNTQEYININDILSDPKLSVKIDGVATNVFTQSGILRYVYIYYENFECLYGVTVSQLKAKKIELINHPISPVINSAAVSIGGGYINITYSDGTSRTVVASASNLSDYWRLYNVVDMSAGEVKITYNNNTTEIISTDDTRLEILWKEFDNSKLGVYEITFVFEELQLNYNIEVIDAREAELIVYRPETNIYQDSGIIDITDWEYSILLTNGRYRAFDSIGSTRASVNMSMLKSGTNPDFTTTTPGSRSYVLEYRSMDNSIYLQKAVNFEVLAKQISAVVEFVEPTVKIYGAGDAIDITGGKIKLRYNDGSITNWLDITKDMQVLPDGELTSSVVENVEVELLYEDIYYNSQISFSYYISVVRKATALVIVTESTGHKTNYILGESFDSTDLVVRVTFGTEEGSPTYTISDFSGAEWAFANTQFNSVGSFNVTLYYGDINNSNVFVNIPVMVTNNIVGIRKDTGFTNFGQVLEGLDITIGENAYIIATRQNGAEERVKILSSMINYNKADNALGLRNVTITYAGFSIVTTVVVLQRSLTQFSITKAPDKLSYIHTDAVLSLLGMKLSFAFNNNTSATKNGAEINSVIAEDSDANHTIYALAVGRNNYKLSVTTLNTDLDGNRFIEQVITVAVLSTDNTLLLSDTFDIICFEKLISEISFQLTDSDEQSFVLNEGDELVFPYDAVINVLYADNSSDTVNLDTLVLNEDYTLSGYNKNRAGNQTVTISYLFSSCTFTVKVRAKLLESIIVNPNQITIIEGMAISSDDVSVRLHFVDANGEEFPTPMYINVELNSVISTYNKNDVVIFYLQDEHGHWYFEANYTFSYTYTYYDIDTKTNVATTKSTEVLIRISRKTMTGISMRTFPKQVYIEDIAGQPASTLDLNGGDVLITYNNGTNMTLALNNANLTILNNEFDTSEIHNGSEKNQKITISYTENNVTMTTYYYVVVKDRRYLTVDYQDNPNNNTYLFEYGTGESARPNFYVNGYHTYNGSRTVLADNSDIEEIDGFSLYYIDSDSNISATWPKNVGIYTLVIEFAGNAINNPFIDNSRKIEIYPKSIVVRAEGRNITYGYSYSNQNAVYSWYVQGYHRNGTVITYTDNPLLYGETLSMVAEIRFAITTKSSQSVNFYTNGGTTIVNAPIGTYNLNPVLITQQSNNYRIEEYKAADLVIVPKQIKVVAQSATKVYGQADPRFEYLIYDESNNLIGGNAGGAASGIWLGGYETGYWDGIPGYTLGRRQTDTNNVLDTHEILAGAASQITNYNVISYTGAVLTVTPKPIVITAADVQKSFGSETPDIVYYLKSGSTMAYGESFNALFDDFFLKTGSKYYVRIYHIDDTEQLYELSSSGDLSPYIDIGQYVVYHPLVYYYIDNYNVTVEPVIITVVPARLDVLVDCITSIFGQREIDNVLDTAHNDRYIFTMDSSEYSLQFESNFILDELLIEYEYDVKEYLELEFAKAAGKNVGKYQIFISSSWIENNPNYIVNIIGNYDEYYANFISTFYPSGASGIPANAGADGDKAYFIIMPVAMQADIDDDGEIYSRKTTMRLDTIYSVNAQALSDVNILSNLNSALGFNFTNKTSTRANLGFFTADDYYGGYTYNYFANIDSRNYLCSGNQPENALKEVYNYILNGIVGSFVITHSFDYTIYPMVLDVELLNTNSNYNGTAFNLNFSGYSLVSPSDTLSIVTLIKVIYNDTVNEVIATKVQEAGQYSVSLVGVSNYNYVLSEASLSAVKNFTISPIEVKIAIPNSETKLVRQYNGKTIQPLDNNWVDAKGADDEIGYFRTTSYKIVNDVLQAAPKAISIYPVDPETSNYPRNAGTYDLVVRINSTYKNLNVVFVRLNPDWSGVGIENKYIPAEYDFTITKKTISVYNWDRCNKKTYDQLPPAVSNINQLIINNLAPGDVITASDLLFSFTRDMNRVPASLSGIVESSDNISAGYFNVVISIKQSNANWKNYNFSIEGGEDYYLINRVSVPVTLNTSNSSLNKQYDKLAPSGALSDLNVGQAVIFDEVYFDLVVRYYNVSNSWVDWSSNNVYNVGRYAYNLRPKYLDGLGQYRYFEDELGEPIYDETYTNNKLLSWNYSYYISAQLGLDTNNCDGIYEIKKKDVSISLTNAQEEVFDYGGGNSQIRYVYSHTYNNQSITLASALNEVNSIFVMLDKFGNSLNLGYYNDFVKLNMTGSGTTVRNAGEYFELSFANMVAANPNYNITNKPIVYAVKKLAVSLYLDFVNAANDDEPSMTYGDSAFVDGNINFRLSFVSLAAFNLATGYEYTDILNFISGDNGDYNNDKLIYSTARFKLGTYYTSAIGSLVSSYPYTILNANTYYPSVENLTAMNYQITIIGRPFTVYPKEIAINGVHRDYFSTNIIVDYFIAGGSINNAVEQGIVTSWIFNDNTAVNADASKFSLNINYYAYILKTQMVTNNTNYILKVTECEGLSGTNQAYYYLPLTVRKVNLVIGLTNASGSPVSVQYGHVLSSSEYKFTYGNLPVIDFNSPSYNPAAEATKQNDALAYIENEIINREAIINRIRTTAVGSYYISLYDYLQAGADLTVLTNYSITFNNEVQYIINKIVLNLEMINNAGVSYNPNGYFSILFDEANMLSYNTSSNQRLTYRFTITNPNSIIRPAEGSVATLVEQMTYILGLSIDGNGKVVHNGVATAYTTYANFVNNYIAENIKYMITSASGNTSYTAGLNKIKLTDNWYNSQNYTLSCTAANIMIYPKIKNIGSAATAEAPYSANSISFSAASLRGLQVDYDTAIYNLSMYLQLFYNGFAEGNNVEWVDIYRNVIPDYYAGANYNRTWSVNVVGEQTIEVGKDLRLTLTMTESFYNDMGAGIIPVTNTIESKEFLVRIYSPTGSTVIDSDSSQIVKALDSGVTYQYKQQIDGNYTYYITESNISTNNFVGKFDILSVKLKLNAKADSDTYYADLILFENAINKLVLRVSGGLSGSYQIIMTDKQNNDIYYSDLLPSLDEVDLFDGMSHTLKIYIDKLGHTENTVTSAEGSSIVISNSRYYKVMWVIDDAYSCNLNYLGGQTIETISVNGATGLPESVFAYDKYINFDNNGYFGFTLSNAKMTIISMIAETIGVKLTNDGFVSDFILWPSAFSGNFSYYVTDDGNLNAETILEMFTFNSGDGYSNSTVYVETNVINDMTGEAVLGEMTRGTYLVTYKTFYRMSSTIMQLMETRTIRLIVSSSNYRRVGIKDVSVPNYSKPVIFESASGENYYSDELGAYGYSKYVFDYNNIVGNSNSIATIMLKTNENRTLNIQTYDENYPAYRGLALTIAYNNATQSFETVLHVRIGIGYWTETFNNIDWHGSRNILETRYSKSTGVIMITLYRGGAQLFSYTLRNAAILGLSGDNVKTIAEMAGYTAMNLYNISLKMYAMELDSNIDTCLDIKDRIINTDTVLIDGDNAPISTTCTNTFFSFKATGTEFKFIFANTVGTTPVIGGINMISDHTGKRGLYLRFSQTRVELGVYKYNLEFASQVLVNRNLLDGQKHDVSIEITKETVPSENIVSSWYKNIVCYKVIITIDKISYAMPYPAYNDLRLIASGGTTNLDDEVEETAGFLNDYRFLALVPISANVDVKEMILY